MSSAGSDPIFGFKTCHSDKMNRLDAIKDDNSGRPGATLAVSGRVKTRH